MDLKICIKYLDFIAAECNRHLADGEVSDDELLELNIELPRFLKEVGKSDIPEEIKLKISNVKLEYESSKIDISIGIVLVWIISAGVSAYLSGQRIQQKRKNALLDLKGQVQNINSYIKWNY